MFFFPSSWNRRSCGRPSNAGARPKKTRVCRTRPTTTRSPSPSSTSPSVLFPSSFSVDFILKKKASRGVMPKHQPMPNLTYRYETHTYHYCRNTVEIRKVMSTTLFSLKKTKEEIEKSIELLPQSLDGVDGATFGSFFRWFPESLPLFGLEIGPWNTNVGHRTRRLPRLQRVLLGFELEFTGFLSGLNWLLPSTLVRCVFPGCSDFFSGICRVPLDLVGLVFFSTFAAYYRVLIGVCNRGNRTDNTKPVPGKEQQQGSVSGKQRKKWHQAKGIGRDKENQKSQAGGKNE